MADVASRPTLRLAVLGHAGHGKSALVAALTAHTAARHDGVGARSAELRWSMGHSGQETRLGRPTVRAFRFDGAERVYVGLDVAAGPRLVRHAATVASTADSCVLVVSALEGPMVQTRQHALLAAHLTPGRVVVFLSRCDEVSDPELIDRAEVEARRVLYDVGIDGDSATVIRGAAQPSESQRGEWGPSLDALLGALDRELDDVPRDVDSPLWATVLHRTHQDDSLHYDAQATVSVRRGTLKLAGATVVPVGTTFVLRDETEGEMGGLFATGEVLAAGA